VLEIRIWNWLGGSSKASKPRIISKFLLFLFRRIFFLGFLSLISI
jgi:hypothetical protein